MTEDEKYMQRCLEIALLGLGNVAPNPLVGSLVVHKQHIIGQGYHQEYGYEHAEVIAIESVENKALLKDSTLYVNLEPCSHYGKTPPCADMIIRHKIRNVVIGCIDIFDQVSGRGVENLKNAGVNVRCGVLEKECIELNRRFFTFHENKRPYIILKWAQTLDGYIDIVRDEDYTREPVWISNELSRTLVHKWRTEEQAIIVGTNTAEKDDPQLNVRDWSGKNPIRIILDRNRRLPEDLSVFDQSIYTILLTARDGRSKTNFEYLKVNFDENVLSQILTILYQRNIQSIIVEGGSQLLQSFIQLNCWDEARVFTGNTHFLKGIHAPPHTGQCVASESLQDGLLHIFRNL